MGFRIHFEDEVNKICQLTGWGGRERNNLRMMTSFCSEQRQGRLRKRYGWQGLGYKKMRIKSSSSYMSSLRFLLDVQMYVRYLVGSWIYQSGSLGRRQRWRPLLRSHQTATVGGGGGAVQGGKNTRRTQVKKAFQERRNNQLCQLFLRQNKIETENWGWI